MKSYIHTYHTYVLKYFLLFFMKYSIFKTTIMTLMYGENVSLSVAIQLTTNIKSSLKILMPTFFFFFFNHSVCIGNTFSIYLYVVRVCNFYSLFWSSLGLCHCCSIILKMWLLGLQTRNHKLKLNRLPQIIGQIFHVVKTFYIHLFLQTLLSRVREKCLRIQSTLNAMTELWLSDRFSKICKTSSVEFDL